VSKLIPTAELTLGPFFPPRYVDAGANDLTMLEGRRARGGPIELHGRVTQEDGAPMDNLILEIWQADAAGIFRHAADPRHLDADPNFLGWGRAATNKAGEYRFRSIKPGAYAMPDGKARAPHINVLVVFSGLMRQLQTVVFFEGEPGNEADPVLNAVQPAALRSRLIARRDGPGRYRFDIKLRGEGETPFFQD
jgi:protocatechuate 3,4-dioxygenase alpha subunit